MIAELIGWIATIFRGSGMLAKRAEMVKYLVSIGNLCWMINGIMTRNLPLIVSNGFCLLVMIWEIVPKKRSKRGLDVRLLRKWRKEAEKKYIVMRRSGGFQVCCFNIIDSNNYGSFGPLPWHKTRESAIEHCNLHRRMYILSQIEKRIY